MMAREKPFGANRENYSNNDGIHSPILAADAFRETAEGEGRAAAGPVAALEAAREVIKADRILTRRKKVEWGERERSQQARARREEGGICESFVCDGGGGGGRLSRAFFFSSTPTSSLHLLSIFSI